VTDGRTDGQTEFSSHRPRLHSVQRGKNYQNKHQKKKNPKKEKPTDEWVEDE